MAADKSLAMAYAELKVELAMKTRNDLKEHAGESELIFTLLIVTQNEPIKIYSFFPSTINII